MIKRFLVIAVGEEHRMLVRKHIEIEWPTALVTDFKLDDDPAFPPGFCASGYDAVVIVTNHKIVNYRELMEWNDTIIDTRNALNNLPAREHQVWKA